MVAILAVMTTFTPLTMAVLPLFLVPAAVPRRIATRGVQWFERKAWGGPPSDWRVHFRLSKPVFKYIVSAVKDHAVFAIPNRNARSTSVTKLVAIFLYSMGAPVQIARVASIMDVSPNTVVRAMRDVPIAIIDCLRDNVAWPQGAERTAVKQAFASMGFPGCVGIIDCTHVQLVPTTKARQNGTSFVYMNRKSHFTQVYQLIVGTNLMILDACGGAPGSVSDMTVFKSSAIFQNLRAHIAPDEYLLGDCGYAVRSHVTTGFKKPEIANVNMVDPPCARSMESYNHFFSGVRITVERAIGVLKVRMTETRGTARVW